MEGLVGPLHIRDINLCFLFRESKPGPSVQNRSTDQCTLTIEPRRYALVYQSSWYRNNGKRRRVKKVFLFKDSLLFSQKGPATSAVAFGWAKFPSLLIKQF